ncbi:MAG: Ig-like domain-containing protein [Bacteroidales bacterium]|nr:Ig-like domain-containing protein [Bacteroidales bacterium]
MKPSVKISLSLIAAILIGGLCSCAKQGFPSGGPVDKQPPKVKGVNPQSETTNYSAKKFKIDFDEYVTMKDADNNVLISPPMKVKPEYLIKGRSVVVKLNDTLTPNTTYLFQFKGAIVDYNEGNPLPSFEYVFSTGDALDSMTIAGKVADALKQAPVESSVSVLAYRMTEENEALGDSIVALGTPTYQTRTASDGSFRFNYVTPGRYKLVALEDADKNLKYSLSESIAWLDSTVAALDMPKPADTTRAANDTLAPKQEPAKEVDEEKKSEPTLLMSLKENPSQRVTSSAFTAKGCLQVTTQMPMVAPVVEADSLIWTLNAAGDTLRLWTLRRNRDSVHLVLRDTATSLDDTLTVKYREPKKSKRKSDTPEKDLNVVRSLVASTHPYFDTMRVGFDVPVNGDTFDSIPVMNLADSSWLYARMTLDDIRSTGAIVAYTPLKQGEKYRITIPAGLCRDLYGRPNDSLVFTTTVSSAEDYATLSLEIKINGTMTHPVVQLLDEGGSIVRQQEVSSASMRFDNLKPTTCRVRLFDDLDLDGKWTAGDYYLRRQPEPVRYFSKTLQLRANWEMYETWNLE